MSDLLFSRRLTWVIYLLEDGESYLEDCWSGDIIKYMECGYNAKSVFSNTMDDRVTIHFINPEDKTHYCATLIESRYADRFIHK